jgi:hypothetical protein
MAHICEEHINTAAFEWDKKTTNMTVKQQVALSNKFEVTNKTSIKYLHGVCIYLCQQHPNMIKLPLPLLACFKRQLKTHLFRQSYFER